MTIPLAIIAGAALGSNPNLAPLLYGWRPQPPATLTAPPPSQPAAIMRAPLDPAGRRGAESPELRALRLAEDQLFPDLPPSPPGLGPQSVSVAPPATCEPPSSLDDPPDNISTRFNIPNEQDFLRGMRLPDLPVRRHRRVAKYIRYFTSDSTGRKTFTTWLRRSGKYRSIIARELGKRGLPKDLEAVVFIESGFWPTAVSSAGATGLWQFMPKTARAYGLTVAPAYDERRSIWRSTEAATEHLKDLYTRFHSWDLALAAYNMGYKNLEGRLRAQGTDDFWALSEIQGAMPKETALYVPKVLAVAVIINNLDEFGFYDVDIAPPIRAAKIDVPPGVALSLLARAAGTSVRALRALNPELKTAVTPDRGSTVSIHIPSTGVARARVLLPKLLGDDADRLDLQVSDDFDWGRDEIDTEGQNRLERTARAGSDADPFGIMAIREKYRKPEVSSIAELSGAAKAALLPKPFPSGTRQRDVLYRVRRGDTLSEIAQRFGLPQRELVELNELRNPSLVKIGEFLKMNVPVKRVSRARGIYYRVKVGETLAQIADSFGVAPEQIAKQNRVKDPDALRVGRLLRIEPNES